MLDAAKPAALGLSADRLDRIGPWMEGYVESGKLAGCMTLVARHGQVAYFDWRGQADEASGRPMAADDIFRIYSMTKPIASVAAMSLFEEGRFQLDDPVARFLPEFGDMRLWLEGEGDELSKKVEAGKKQYVGYELPGRTLGVVGLGAIGVQVANAAQSLGMNVIGFDAMISVERAWQLHSGIEQARSLEDLLSRSDMVSLHVPLLDATRGLISKEGIARMPQNAVILNFARDPIVDETAVLASLDAGHLGAYVTDFPTRQVIGHDKVITLPHLGASTHEAEINCAIMVAEQVKDYLENGNIKHSVNFPEAIMPRTKGAYRLTVANKNVPNMVGQISTCLADAGLNIEDLLNKSRGDIAYTIVDVNGDVTDAVVEQIGAIEGVIKVRNLGPAG